jgi:hypothetical protein
VHRKIIVIVSILAALLIAAPVASAGHAKGKGHASGSFGATTLKVAPATLDALTALGVTPGAVSPAKLGGATYSFPIVSSLRGTLQSGVVGHTGGISLSAGDTTVSLTDFGIRLADRQLYGKVNGEGPVALLDLDYSNLRVRIRGGRLVIGPVGTTLTAGAAQALNQAFGTSALSDDTVIGKAKIRYRLFPS